MNSIHEVTPLRRLNSKLEPAHGLTEQRDLGVFLYKHTVHSYSGKVREEDERLNLPEAMANFGEAAPDKPEQS